MVRWRVHDERAIYESAWVNLALARVEPPGVEPFDHHVVRAPGPAAGCVVTRVGQSGGTEVLLLYRHRFITDTWGWEVPAGGVDAGETPAAAAVRETLEETGWQPQGPPEPLIVFHPSNGLSDQTFHIFTVAGASHVGDPTDPSEASEIAWRTALDVRRLMAEGQITDGLSLTALSVSFTLGFMQ